MSTRRDRRPPKDRRGMTALQDGWARVEYVQAWESYSSMELHRLATEDPETFAALHRDYLERTGRG